MSVDQQLTTPISLSLRNSRSPAFPLRLLDLPAGTLFFYGADTKLPAIRKEGGCFAKRSR